MGCLCNRRGEDALVICAYCISPYFTSGMGFGALVQGFNLGRSLRSNLAGLSRCSLFFLWMAARAFRKSSGALQTIQQTLAASGASDGLGQLLAQLDPLARFIGGIGGVLLCTMLLVWALDRAGTKTRRLNFCCFLYSSSSADLLCAL